jgi:drug/metabolite transporter (DMT)-like permease
MEALAMYRTARLVWVRRMSNVKRIGALAAGFTGIAVIALPAIWTLSVALPRITNFTFTRCAIAAVTVSGIIGTGLANAVFGTLLQLIGVTRATISTYFTPIVGLALGNVFNNENTALLSVVGMFIVISSVWRISKPDERAVMLGDCAESSSQKAHWWCGRALGLVL